MATKKKKPSGYSGGKESLLSGMAIFFLFLGVLGSSASFGISLWTDLEFGPAWGVLGVAIFVQGLFLYAITGAGADIIRLLKMQNGLPFGGKISEADTTYIYLCSECGKKTDMYENFCSSCNVEFSE